MTIVTKWNIRFASDGLKNESLGIPCSKRSTLISEE
jgi:hypothetical protein